MSVTRLAYLCSIFLVAMSPLLYSTTAHAQATRTWVSGVGDDANPCSRTAPCKTFAGAISKTSANGQINVLDPGGFGAVTITKAITISAEGVEGGVLVSGTNGIVVAAGAADNVILSGLDIEGVGTGINGIRFLSGASLTVENCQIHNFTTWGLDVELSAVGTVVATNVRLSNNGNQSAHTGGGILLQPSGSTTVVKMSGLRVDQNAAGIQIGGAGTVLASVAASSVSLNGSAGVGNGITISGGSVTLDSDLIIANSGSGVSVTGGTARLGNSTVSLNSTGISVASGTLNSWRDNQIAGNTADGALPITVVPSVGGVGPLQ